MMETETESPALLEAYRELRRAMKAHRDYCATSAEGCDPYCCRIYLQNTVDAIDEALDNRRSVR